MHMISGHFGWLRSNTFIRVVQCERIFVEVGKVGIEVTFNSAQFCRGRGSGLLGVDRDDIKFLAYFR